ncbi:sporulation YhaL family protein [Cytobacillus solani]|uniref:sporulation YhaL family protein n=1 Tax=Cytobacillus solani TaxID=1637975 RepID=UPI0006ABCEC9|nr:SigE-dependent sporulation protein [Bacillus sp. FJAT-21945]
MMTIPLWAYVVVAGILISAYMAFRTGKEERKLEDESIELEGRVYMERIQKEKEARRGV